MAEDILSWEYYYDKLPQYMKNSYGIAEHFKLWWSLLYDLFKEGGIKDKILKAFCVFDNDYLDFINSIDSTQSDILDKIASLFGFSRSFHVKYYDYEDLSTHDEQLYLTNDELLKLIKARIIQNQYDGTREMAKEFYENIGLGIYYINDNTSGVATVYLVHDKNATVGNWKYVSDNELKLFKAGLFTLKSVGIIYRHTTTPIETLALWDNEGDISRWDVGMWGI